MYDNIIYMAKILQKLRYDSYNILTLRTKFKLEGHSNLFLGLADIC